MWPTVWLSTFHEVLTNLLANIWIRPLDYRKSIQGTAHDLNFKDTRMAYRRQGQRERLVEAVIAKLSLLTNQGRA